MVQEWVHNNFATNLNDSHKLSIRTPTYLCKQLLLGRRNQLMYPFITALCRRVA